MNTKIARRPKLGILALMLEGYEPLFPGIIERQRLYVEEIRASIADVTDTVFPGVACSREKMEEYTELFNREHLDGILIFLLTYAQGQYIVHAMQRNHLPLALALVQPEETVRDDFQEIDLTVNQGIHGSQDNANCLMRAGIPCAFFAGSRLNGELRAFAADFAAAARTVTDMKNMKISLVGRLQGMGDVISDDMAIFRKLGPEIISDSIGTVWRCCEAITDDSIRARMALEREWFEVDETLPETVHAEAVRMYLGLKKYLEERGYAGYSAHFEEFGEDGRFTRLPLLAASSLMADGYGYGAEGDATAALLMAAMIRLCGHANFSEMYMMDLHRDAVLLCHQGEGNWAVARKDRKPYLKNRVLSEGGLDNPPTLLFTPEPGRAAVLSLVHTGGDNYRLVFARGEILDEHGMKYNDMPYMFFRPDSGVRNCITHWLEQGGSHHEIIVNGDVEERVRLWCKLAGIEFVSL